jgi:hypothetical protein
MQYGIGRMQHFAQIKTALASLMQDKSLFFDGYGGCLLTLPHRRWPDKQVFWGTRHTFGNTEETAEIINVRSR